jgi:pimeloyl-ACP methyl ester carboxylesterase
MPKSGKATKTVLFCAGGPGQFIGPTSVHSYTDFLTANGYNVVHYHPRGAGFSQIPAQNRYDRFLKTSYLVRDIEAIRKHFLGPSAKWDAVIGYSFGTVIAQYYAAEYKSNLERLILIGPQSRHLFNDLRWPPRGPSKLEDISGPFGQITSEILDIYRTTLEKIFQREDFSALSPTEKNSFVDIAFGPNGVYKRAEETFGSLPFVLDSYCELKANNDLATNNLNYSQKFFKALWELRNVGWSPQSPTQSGRQLDFAKDIRNELEGNVSNDVDCGPDWTGSSDRVFYAVSFFDGLNRKFLSKWLTNGKTGVKDAVRASAGEVHYTRGGINRFVDRVGISDTEPIEPWDPARYNHDVSTLILKGSADTVPAKGASEYIFLNALAGPRTLIEFPGVGHSYNLGDIPDRPPPSDYQTVDSSFSDMYPQCSPGKSIRHCLIYTFLEMSPTDFKDTAVNQILKVIISIATKDTHLDASVCYRDQNLAQTLVVSGSCP